MTRLLAVAAYNFNHNEAVINPRARRSAFEGDNISGLRQINTSK
jgi:hypothetical protein